jgi:hypothetical protein
MGHKVAAAIVWRPRAAAVDKRLGEGLAFAMQASGLLGAACIVVGRVRTWEGATREAVW